MQSANKSSRRRFDLYKEDFKERLAKGTAASSAKTHGWSPGIGSSPGIGHKRQRSFWVLLHGFYAELRPFRLMIAAVLLCTTLSTLLGLLPLYGTKIVFDSVLAGKPLDQTVPGQLAPYLPDQPRRLLAFIALATVALAVVSIFLNMWARFHATRITKRIQVALRRKVFNHAVRLPLHRVYELKSGGAASLLREDAGGVGELIFAMLFNPWRAIVQLLGSLTILAFTDWRLLLGSLVLFPMVYFTHKTWIGRIRPLFSDIRATRTHTDSHATETFGGMRVVRSFSRQRSEASQFTRNNALMARQELLAWTWSRVIDVAWGMLIPGATAALFWYGGSRILDDQARVLAGTLAAKDAMTLGDLMMFLAYLGWLLGPLELLASSATQFQNSLAGFDRVLNVLGEPTEMPDRPGARRIPANTPPGRITLRDVGFTYPGVTEPVLKGVNLEAAPGEMIAFVGPSGAG
ncbi:MAG: ABC transporter transmembrane domain-containing protein, partial [Planctomycetota bacterium]|nr:ABC transporter transmembrane domain-containing protein [Planctomycetota bacterium]